MNDQTELVVNGWFTNKQPSYDFSWHILRKCMSVHFFMYYMIRNGEKNGIYKDKIQHIKGHITKKNFIQELIKFYENAADVIQDGKSILNILLKNKLKEIPNRFMELSPQIKDENMKNYKSKYKILEQLMEDQELMLVKRAILKQEFTYLHKYLSENELSDGEAQDLTNRMIEHWTAAKTLMRKFP